jgi:hypothetical protein
MRVATCNWIFAETDSKIFCANTFHTGHITGADYEKDDYHAVRHLLEDLEY